MLKWLERTELSVANHWEFDSVPAGLIGFSRCINLQERGEIGGSSFAKSFD